MTDERDLPATERARRRTREFWIAIGVTPIVLILLVWLLGGLPTSTPNLSEYQRGWDDMRDVVAQKCAQYREDSDRSAHHLCTEVLGVY